LPVLSTVRRTDPCVPVDTVLAMLAATVSNDRPAGQHVIFTVVQ
jgi:hypothetical protein